MRLLSGQKLIAVAGIAEPIADVGGRTFALRALSTNTDVVYVGNDGAGDVTPASGYELSAGQTIVVEPVGGNLNSFFLDAPVTGEGVCWLRLS